jgi:hypothetical protein
MVTPSAEESSTLESPHLQTGTIRVVEEVRQGYDMIEGQQQPNHHPHVDNEIITTKIDLAAAGLPEYVSKQLKDLNNLSSENTLNIIDFILAEKTEVKKFA